MKKNIVFKDNFAFLYLNKNIYTKSKIKEAIIEFKDFIKPSISQIGEYIVIKIETITQDYDLKELTYEFANYILAKEQQTVQ